MFNQNYVEEKLIPTWNWMVSIMDSTEAQLRYGSALSSAGDPGHPSHPLHASQHSARRERMTAREEASLRTLEGRRYFLLPFHQTNFMLHTAGQRIWLILYASFQIVLSWPYFLRLYATFKMLYKIYSSWRYWQFQTALVELTVVPLLKTIS